MRVADLGVTIGLLPSGPTASIIDVPGVGVGHATVEYDEPAPPDGRGIARTGVTVVDPGGDCLTDPVPSGVAILNGAGELTGRSQIEEWGYAETPVFLTSTMQVGRVYDAACQLLMSGTSTFGEVLIPIVGECDDSWLNDPRTMHVTFEDVRDALDAARAGGEFEQGVVGAGTGMSCLGWKGGIGSASRVLPDGHVVGVLLLTNFGSADRLTFAGVDVGRHLDRSGFIEPPPAGSCIGVVVTDAPLDAAACKRLATRVGLGLARTGSVAHHGSGEIFIGMANGLRSCGCGGPAVTGRDLDPYFAAVVEASEEAVLASLVNARTLSGYQGRTIEALPLDEVRPWLR